MFKIYLASIILLFIKVGSISAQGTAGEKAIYESRYIVDMPTAGVLDKSTYTFYSNAFSNGGIMLQLDISPFSDFVIGLSYSGSNIIGSGDANFQSIPGVHLRYRFLDETVSLPAFLIGVNTQGRGNYNKADKRFETYSPGVFLAMSKNYSWVLGTIAGHAGVNYSFEPPSTENLPNVYFGAEHSIGKSVAVNIEFNSTLNDDNKKYMTAKGILNTSLRWSLAKGVTLELQVRDLLGNLMQNKKFNRAIVLEYISTF